MNTEAQSKRYQEILEELGSLPRVGTTAYRNRLVLEAHRLAKQMRTSQAGRAAIEALLKHPDPGVRLTAASEALMWAPARAERVLLEVQESAGGINSFEAGLLLVEFRAGRLSFDWGEEERASSRRDPAFRETDREAILTFHGLVMQGGLAHAFEADFESAQAVPSRLRAAHLDSAAEIVEEVSGVVQRLSRSGRTVDVLDLDANENARLEELDRRYSELVPSDASLIAALERR